MVGGGVLSLAALSETGHKRYIIKRESVCHEVFVCVFSAQMELFLQFGT
jgi:hypothetical protein